MTQSSPAIVESRELAFYERGILLAISSSLRSASAFGLPSVPAQAIRLVPDGGQAFIVYGSGAAAKSVSIEAEPLGALLVSYCIRSKIPIPKSADKGVRIEAQRVVLAFRVAYDDPPVPTVDEPTRMQSSTVRSYSW
jgi:hypothetical protein